MLKNRKLATFALFFAFAAVMCIYFPKAIIFLVIASGMLCLFTLILFIIKLPEAAKWLKPLLVQLIPIALGVFLCTIYITAYNSFFIQDLGELADTEIQLTGRITELSYNEYYNTTFTKIKVDKNDAIKANSIIVIYFDDNLINQKAKEDGSEGEYPQKYDKITFTAILNSNITLNSRAEGVDFYGNIINYELKRGQAKGISNLLDIVSKRIGGFFDSISFWSESTKGIAKKVIINNSTEINPKTNFTFRRAGIIHFLSISGFHMTIVTGMILGILYLCQVPLRVRIPICFILAILYASMVGFVPSVARSLLMLIIGLGATLFWQISDLFTSMSAAMLIMLIINPYSIADIGFQLSFLSVIGIVCAIRYAGKFELKLRMKENKNVFVIWVVKNLFTPFLISLFAFLFTLPVVLTLFNEAPAISPVFNLFVAPILSILLLSLFTSASFGVIWAPLGLPFAFIGGKISDLIQWLTRIASNDSALIIINSKNLFIPLVFLILGLILVLFATNKKMRKIAIAYLSFTLILFISISFWFSSKEMEKVKLTSIETISSSHLIISSGASHILFDFSSSRIENKLLNENGITNISACVFDSISKRTVNNIKRLISKNILKKIYIPSPSTKNLDLFYELAELAEKEDFELILYDESELISIGNSRGGIRFFSAENKRDGFALVAEFNENAVLYAGAMKTVPSEYLSYQYCSTLMLTDSFFRSPNFTALPDLEDIETIIAFDNDVFHAGMEKILQKGGDNIRLPNKMVASNTYTLEIAKDGSINILD